MTEKRYEKVASMTMHGVGGMSADERKNLAGWLRYHARMIVKEGTKYTSKRFTASYSVQR